MHMTVLKGINTTAHKGMRVSHLYFYAQFLKNKHSVIFQSHPSQRSKQHHKKWPKPKK